MERLESRAAVVEEEAGRTHQLEEEVTILESRLRGLQEKVRSTILSGVCRWARVELCTFIFASVTLSLGALLLPKRLLSLRFWTFAGHARVEFPTVSHFRFNYFINLNSLRAHLSVLMRQTSQGAEWTDM